MTYGKIDGMTFEEAVVALDYGNAVVLFSGNLPETFWQAMTLQQRVLAYRVALAKASLPTADKIFQALLLTPADFTSWHEIYGWAPEEGDLKALAMAKMLELASGIGEWSTISTLKPAGEHQRIALEKIGELTSD